MALTQPKFGEGITTPSVTKIWIIERFSVHSKVNKVRKDPSDSGPKLYVGLRRDKSLPTVTASLDVSVKNHLPGGVPHSFSSVPFLFGEGVNSNGGWAWDLLPSAVVLDLSKGWLKDDRLEMTVTITAVVDQSTKLAVPRKSIGTVEKFTSLGSSYASLLDGTAKDSDCTFSVAGDLFNAHRTILSARSPVFRAMFSSGMKESQEGKVELCDISAPVFKQLLRFLYTGECNFLGDEKTVREGKSAGPVESKEITKEEDTADMATSLLTAADRFQVPLLADLAVDHLITTTTGANVGARLLLADSHNAPELRAYCIEFCRAAPARMKQLTASESFKALSPELLKDLLCGTQPAAGTDADKKA